MRRTKIVCTLGPATSTPQIILELVEAGLNVARINMSHGERAQHRETIEHVRAAAAATDRPVAILADLAGPKIRVGDLPSPMELVPGEEIVMAEEDRGLEGDIPTTYAHLGEDIKPGDSVLLDDGLLELECLSSEDGRVVFRVVRGGLLRSRKGINMPGVDLQTPSLTPKDLADLKFALEMNVEYVGLSFVRRAEDIIDLKERLDGKALVVAKIEMASAMSELEGILCATDAVMVARGDLGVELPFEQVPLAQKRIVQLANFHGRPVITATQMLESMIEQPRPTRAEVSDVANAVLDGSDAIMLSGETAVGKFPVQALETMVRIASEIEESGVMEYGPLYETVGEDHLRHGATVREHAVAAATVGAARDMGSPAIIVITRSGFAARLVSSYRPSAPIWAVCTDPETYRQLSAVWGVRPVLADVEQVSYQSLTDFGCQAVLLGGVGKTGDSVPVTSGYPFHESGTTNTMRVERL